MAILFFVLSLSAFASDSNHCKYYGWEISELSCSELLPQSASEVCASGANAATYCDEKLTTKGELTVRTCRKFCPSEPIEPSGWKCGQPFVYDKFVRASASCQRMDKRRACVIHRAQRCKHEDGRRILKNLGTRVTRCVRENFECY